jgi:hypothetical protein
MKQKQQNRAEIRKKQERRNIKGIWKIEEFKARR